MPLDRTRLLAWPVPRVEQRLDATHAILYALALGLGEDPCDERQLAYVYERNLLLMPTFATVVAHPGFWLRDPRTGVAWEHVVHGEQGMHLHRPLTPGRTVAGVTHVTHVADKGPGIGALLEQERVLTDVASGEVLATLTMTTFCRGDGGCGGPRETRRRPLPPLPEGAPQWSHEIPTAPHSALLFRLLGDENPLHADPDVARRAGFERPILHGLCTFGIAGRALVERLCPLAPQRLQVMRARFSAPVYPGETLRTECWLDATSTTVRFRTLCAERGVVVLDRGEATIAPAEEAGLG